MQLPVALTQALETLLAGEDQRALAQNARALSEMYRAPGDAGKPPLTSGFPAAYLASRFPATYAAARQALRWALDCTDAPLTTLLDVGAGPGTAALAALSLLPLESVTLLERNEGMRALQAPLLRAVAPKGLPIASLAGDMREAALPPADLVIAAYTLNELATPQAEAAALRLWQSTQALLLLVEPGTPAGFSGLRRLAEPLLCAGAHIAAPCPALPVCPLAQGEDWCAFAVRVARSALHKRLKGGEAPFEDEKFCYLALTRQPPRPVEARILRHPQQQKGFVELQLCTAQGLTQCRVTRAQPLFRQAKKALAGDAF